MDTINVDFPATPGRYWVRVPSPGPTQSTAYNAIAVLTAVSPPSPFLPAMTLAILPVDPTIVQPGRIWKPSDVLAAGPAVEIPPLPPPRAT